MEVHIHAAQAGELPPLVGAAAIIDDAQIDLHYDTRWPQCARIAAAEGVLNAALGGVSADLLPPRG